MCKSVFVLCIVALLALAVQGRGTGTDQVDCYGLDPPLAQRLSRFATAANLEEALEYSETIFEKSKRLEGSLAAGSRGKVVKGGSTYAQILDGYPTPSTEQQDLLARKVLRASSFFVNRYCIPNGVSSYECGLYLSGTLLPSSPIGDQCRDLIASKEYNDEYRRLLPALYDDGVYAFRRSTTGGELPLAREVSSRFHTAWKDLEPHDTTRSVALVQWTQFIEHDLAKTTVQTMHDGTGIECCSGDHGQLLPRYRHPSCKPIQVPEDDPYYQTYRATCLNYVRSALSLGANGCHLGPANQLNQATNRLDLSQLYGSLANDTKFLRAGKGGRLRAQLYDSAEYLQETGNDRLCATDPNLETVCYDSGDTRVNVNPYITLLHTLFLRSHNRLAKHLAQLQPSWTDDQLFTVARTINVKLYQKIVREWLVTVAGERATRNPHSTAEQDDRVSNEFATAAIRFYNTMMPGEISNALGSYDLERLFYRPKDLRKRDYFAHLVGSVLGQNAMSLDTAYVDDMAHLLFGVRNVGLDVLALDIQRGRDHGLARYTDYYTLCNGKPVTGWADLELVLKPHDLEIIRASYATVHDVDLIVGAIAEWPVTGATVGPTLSCLIREQIDNSLPVNEQQDITASLVKKDRLETVLAGYSAARFMCDTAQVERVQRDIFRVPSDDNPQIRCAQLPALDLARLV
ncbi:peroxidase [Anopheles maculipalpis]|uniref:peroxidase n=1 Tax=Anopheles maculipalpis TaxID=1496333 RepID=UPI0021594FA8|nr:peroxidase [Anopheles maculipalpis]